MGTEINRAARIVLRGAFQDGGQFYRTGPAGVPVIADYGDIADSDMAGAERARERFAREWPEFIQASA